MKSKRNVPLLLVMIASFIIFIFAAGKLIEIYLEYKKGNHTYEELMEYVQEPEADEHGKNDPDPEDESGFTFLQVDFEEIKAQNPDVAAWIQIPALIIKCLECPAIMFISRVNGISQNPTMLITSSFNPICKNMFMFSFTEPPTVWITCAAFLCFYSFRNDIFFIRRIPAPNRRRSLVMIIFIF